MIVETFQWCFHVFMCAFHPEISSFFGKFFPLPIYVLVYNVIPYPVQILTILSLLRSWESFWFNCFCNDAICSLSSVVATTWSEELGSCKSPLLFPAPDPPRAIFTGGPPSPPSLSEEGSRSFVTSTRCGRLLWLLCLQHGYYKNSNNSY